MAAMIIRSFRFIARHFFRALAYGLTGGLVVFLVIGVMLLNEKPELKVWHTTILDEEYKVDSDVQTLEEYLALEDRLFAQLDAQIYQKIEPEDAREINRYNPGSLADPGQAKTNWNHSFEWKQDQPRAGIVLLHGMSDSPYSLQSVATELHNDGAWVVGLRIPGHGQAPSGLVNVTWQDMAGAVEIAVRHIHQKVPDGPLFIAGYSNGGALAVHYALASLTDKSLPPLSGLVLLSPEIGISRLAVFARTQERLGHVLGLEKLAWTDVVPEYDPWKYNSFATNAARQAYQITAEIQKLIDALTEDGRLSSMPPILAFQSSVDATVTAQALLSHLFQRLPPPTAAKGPGWNEMVVFDINRTADIQSLLQQDPLTWMQPMLTDRSQTFMLTLVTNRGDEDTAVTAILRQPGSSVQEVCDIGLQWPAGIYSLSHIALPFPPDDVYYGGLPGGLNPIHRLGQLSLRGEKGVLHVSADSMLRMHWNPFHSYMMGRIGAFTGLAAGPAQTCTEFALPAAP